MKLKYNNRKRKFNAIFLLGGLLIVSLLTISIGFSALSTTLTINGSATFTPVGMIRILSFENDSLVSASEINHSFHADNIDVTIDNENVESKAIYNVTIANLGQTDKVLAGLNDEIFSNDEMICELIGLQIGDVIKAKETVNFQIIFRYKNSISIPIDLRLNAKINFVFDDYKESAFTAYFKAYDGENGLFGFDKTNITSFERNTNLTLNEVLEKAGVEIISNTSSDQYDSKRKIYGWIENGIFYWWSDALIVYFHPDTTRAFYYFPNLVTVDLTGISTEKVQNFAHFFDNCKKLKTIKGQIDTSGLKLEYNSLFDYRNDTNNDSSSGYGLTYMFNDCYVLEKVDLSHFNTKNASDMKRMFSGCHKIKSLDVSSFDTSNVRSMYWMFRKNENLLEIDLSNFDTSNVENMFGMFVEDYNLQTIKLGSEFNTSKVKNMSNMFYGLKNLTTIYAKTDFVRASDLLSNNMFNNTFNLIGSNETEYAFSFNSNYKDKTYAQLATSLQPGYFTPYGDDIRYIITYELNGGVSNNPFYYITGKEITLNEPIKPGYTFIGWTGSNGDVLEKNITISSDMIGNLVYYANYIPNNYTVTFDANGGIGQMDSEIFTYDVYQGLNKNSFIKNDYVFIGWNTEKDGTGMSFSNNQDVANLTLFDNIVLYAQWKKLSEAFVTVFNNDGICYLNGENSNIMGEECSLYTDSKSINTGISLFSDENYLKDFEIDLDINNYDYMMQESTQATIINSLLETNGNPGFVLRRYNNQLQLLARNDKGITKSVILNVTDNMHFKIIRKNGNICYSVNNEDFKYLNNFDSFNKVFDLPVYFGASLDGNGNEWRQIKAALSHLSIKLGQMDDSIICNPNME